MMSKYRVVSKPDLPASPWDDDFDDAKRLEWWLNSMHESEWELVAVLPDKDWWIFRTIDDGGELL